MLKRVLIIVGIVVLVLALALLIFKWVTAPIELDFEVRVKDVKLTDLVDEWIDIDQDKWEDYFSREEDFAVLQYDFEYWSDKDFHTDEHINLGVFFEVFYPNELNDRIFDYTRMKDFGFIYEKDKVNTYRIRVIVEREGLTDEQILEMGRQMQLKVFGLEKYNPDEMSKEMQQDERIFTPMNTLT